VPSIWRNIPEIDPHSSGTSVAIGNFDGVHRGHTQIIATLKGESRKIGTRSLVLTFDPHPSRIIKPDLKLQEITPLPEKARLCFRQGVDGVLALSFTPEFAQLSPEDFFRLLLPPPLDLRAIVIGYDFRFGRSKSGRIDLLESLGKSAGISVRVVPPVEFAGRPIGSRQIRDLLHQGKISTANSLLGHPYTIFGSVVSGRGRGKTIGFPTANLDLSFPSLAPPGVYAVRTEIRRQYHPGVMSVGPRPTFSDPEPSVEIHLIDLPPDAEPQPGDRLRVELPTGSGKTGNFPARTP